MLFSDFVFQPPNINGRWEMVLFPKQADNEALACINLHYAVLFAQKGLELVGSGEKDKDEKSKDERCKSLNAELHHYAPGKGTRMELAGYIENNYLSATRLTFSYREGRHDRFTMTELTLRSDGVWHGQYTSQISRAQGEIELRRVE